MQFRVIITELQLDLGIRSLKLALRTNLELGLNLRKFDLVLRRSLYFILGYLGDILEDLGHPLTESLKSIVFLLKLSPKEFLTSSSGQPQKLVSAVKEMRSIATQPTSRKN